MAWTEITRPKYQRDGLRYASDTIDAEWAIIEPHVTVHIPLLMGISGQSAARRLEVKKGLA